MAKRRGRKRTRTTAKQAAASRRNLEIARRKRRRRRIAVAGATGVALGTGALAARHHISGSSFSAKTGANVSDITGNPLSRGVKVSPRHVRVSTNQKKVTIQYHHKKLTKDALGKSVLGAPSRVAERRPPNAFERRRMNRFNVPMTEEAIRAAKIQASHSEGKVFGHRVRPKKKKEADPVGGRGRRSGGNYSRATGVHSETVGPRIPGTIGGRSARTESRGTTNPQKGRTISQAEVNRRTQAYMESLPKRRQKNRTRRRASRYYEQQPLYTASLKPTRRGRARSRELRRKTK